ncbi:MAG: hypothetical protein VB948_04790 [Pseudomonadales bacterium]
MFDSLLDYLVAQTWVGELFLIVLLTALVRLGVRIVLDRLTRQLRKTSNLYDDALLDAARKPLGLVVWVIGISRAAEVAGGNARADIFEYVDPMREVAIVWLLVWFAVRFIRLLELHLSDSAYPRCRWIRLPRPRWVSCCAPR